MRLIILKVSQLIRYVKSQLDADDKLAEVYVSGEISNLSVNPKSGHLYFTLKDENSSVRVVMFAVNVEFLQFMPQNAMAVVVRGKATLYERDGTFQITASEMMLDGAGSQGAAFEQLKQKLALEGLFDERKKKALPENPSVIGIVTSESGAALQDIISVIKRKNPTVTLLIAPALVQGREAGKSISSAIELLNSDGRSNLIIVARGGGSAEDLWAFNEELPVRAVFNSAIPVVSAVGHETDISLCDLAADFRAATPTAAAELAVCGVDKLFQALDYKKQMLYNCFEKAIRFRSDELDELKRGLAANNSEYFINKNRQILNNLIKSLNNDMLRLIGEKGMIIKHNAEVLNTLSPLNVLMRGYSITELDGRAIKSADDVSVGDVVKTKLASGVIRSIVETVER